MLSLFKKYKQKKEFLAILLVLSLMAIGVFALNSSLDDKTASEAISHSFELLPTPATGFPTSLALILDADAEGGLLGTEVNISYDSSKVSVSSISLGSCPFDSCINLSQPGTIKLLGVSGVGNAVTGSSTLATINLSMSESAIFSFSKCQVIDQANNLKSCGSIPLSVGSTCGDGNIEGAEQCDDGNVTDGDGCSSSCLIESVCGDETAEGSEACDGADLKSQACTDLGFESGTLNCAVDCTFNTSACVAAPEPPAEVCGNSIVEGSETCDDGNNANGDGCSAICELETVCGNSLTEGVEECDDGNADNTDACLDNCVAASCGDGNIQSGVEECDDGNNTDNDGCSAICKQEAIEVPVCGNNIVEGSEQCDDGNNISGDGCSAACLDEAPPAPAVLTPIELTLHSSAGTSIQVGNSTFLSATAKYDDDPQTVASALGAFYGSNNNAVASVSGNLVTANSAGSATISASYTENGVTQGASFTLTVTPPPAVCGNSAVEAGEACDDGNAATESCTYGEASCTVCDASCQQVAGAVTGYCGDSAVNGPEECDDGNALDGDGCSASCAIEIAPEPAPEEPIIEEPTPDEVAEEPAPEEPVRPSAPQSGRIIETETTEELHVALQPTSFANQEVVEQQAVEQAIAIVESTEVIEETVVAIAAPVTQQEVLTRIDFCKLNPQYAGADFDSRSADTDGDGLTDRTECYVGTHPLIADSDNDGFSDGDEVNQLNSDPTVADAPKPVLEIILISDPQPGWILGDSTPRVAGMAPMTATTVTVTALHADQKLINQLESQLFALTGSETEEEFNVQRSEAVEAAREFTLKNGDFFDYSEFSNLLEELQGITFESKTELTGIIGQLNSLKKEPIVLGSTDIFSETFLGADIVKRFEFESSNELEDKKLYDIVATATLNGKTISSSAVRLGINSGLTISEPTPRALGDTPILASMALNNMRIGNAYAQNGFIDIEIDEERPIISGDTEFGSQVFAIWNSLVLASSVISDSEEGAFSLQAPQNLETGVPHRVTLYAVKTDAENTLRSESVDVYFNITPPAAAGLSRMAYAIILSILIALMAIIAVVNTLMHRKRKSIVGEEESGKSAAESGHVFEHFFKKFPEGLRSAAPEGPVEEEAKVEDEPETTPEEPADKSADVKPTDQPAERQSLGSVFDQLPSQPEAEVTPQAEAPAEPSAKPETEPSADQPELDLKTEGGEGDTTQEQ